MSQSRGDVLPLTLEHCQIVPMISDPCHGLSLHRCMPTHTKAKATPSNYEVSHTETPRTSLKVYHMQLNQSRNTTRSMCCSLHQPLLHKSSRLWLMASESVQKRAAYDCRAVTCTRQPKLEPSFALTGGFASAPSPRDCSESEKCRRSAVSYITSSCAGAVRPKYSASMFARY